MSRRIVDMTDLVLDLLDPPYRDPQAEAERLIKLSRKVTNEPS